MEKLIKTNALFVLSDYNWLPEDVENSWVTKYTDNYLILDRYHRYQESEKIKWQDNLGQNVYDIFDFIYIFHIFKWYIYFFNTCFLGSL